MTYKKQDDFYITLLRSDNLAESWQPELHVVFILRGMPGIIPTITLSDNYR